MFRGTVHSLIPDICPYVSAAVEARNIPPGMSHSMSVGPLWMFLYFVTRTNITLHELETLPLKCPANTAILIRPGNQYRIDTRPAGDLSHHVWVVFDGLQPTPLAALVRNRGGYLTFADPDMVLLERMLSVVDAAERQRPAPFWSMQAPGRILLDIMNTAANVRHAAFVVTRETAKKKPDPLVTRVIQFLQDNLTTPVRLSAIAAHVHASVSTTSHRYRAATGEAPMQTLRRLRLLRAKVMLSQGHLLADIAEHLCFYDERHLALAFRRSEGMSPREFIKRTRAK